MARAKRTARKRPAPRKAASRRRKPARAARRAAPRSRSATKRTARKPARPAARRAKPLRPKLTPLPRKVLVGRISHYFTAIGVGVIELSAEIRKGDRISIEGATTNLQQRVESMQVDRKPVERAGPGQSVGILVKERVREGDLVFRA
ncbi:MAG: hypothetical protein HY520_02200 [Candidatus Aenigmarchaeota archaeon]|nr:hypothetical protein [Candidatus Aenigmarchaeota archaeon]